MTVSLFWRIQTADFDSWLNPDSDALAQMMQSQGVAAYSTHRDTGDPNSAVVHLQFADRGALDAFEAWYAPTKEAWLKEFPGSEHTVAERWVCDDLPGYARSFH